MSKMSSEYPYLRNNSIHKPVNTKPMPKLRKLAKFMNISTKGTRPYLVLRVETYLTQHCAANIIQRAGRTYIQRELAHMRGPGLSARDQCKNIHDVNTWVDIADIPASEFFSYMDELGHIYGFTMSTMMLIIRFSANREEDYVRNPYTRIPIARYDLCRFISLCIATGTNFNAFAYTTRVMYIFHYLAQIGFDYEVEKWMRFSTRELICFIHNLMESLLPMSYREKMRICPPMGTLHFLDPDSGTAWNGYTALTLDNARIHALNAMSTCICRGYSMQDRRIGGFYVMQALSGI